MSTIYQTAFIKTQELEHELYLFKNSSGNTPQENTLDRHRKIAELQDKLSQQKRVEWIKSLTEVIRQGRKDIALEFLNEVMQDRHSLLEVLYHLAEGGLLGAICGADKGEEVEKDTDVAIRARQKELVVFAINLTPIRVCRLLRKAASSWYL